MRQAVLLCYLQILRQFLFRWSNHVDCSEIFWFNRRTIEPAKKTDAKNQTSVYTYDNAGRMTQIVQTDAANNTKTINFTYGDAGNLLSYNDGTTSASYTYDNLYRKTQETTNYGAFSLTTSYSYNQNGTKKSFTYPNGTTIGYTYDANNQPLGINIPGAGSVAYNQYQWTRPQSVTLPDGGTSQYAYDELMRTKAITKKDYAANPQMNYAYTYDKMDNIKTRNTQNGNYAYNYDNLYRLNEVKKDTQQTEGYTYDQVGNRTTSKATTGDWTYNSNNELLSTPLSSSGSTGGSSYVYDANGNTIQKTVNGQIQNYVYNADNRLVEVKDATNNNIAKYTYDPFGRRIKKTVSGGAGTVSPSGGGSGEVTTYYLYSDEGLIGEYDSAGTEIKTYGYKPNSTWSTDPIFCHSHEGGKPEYYFYHNDHFGTPQKMTNLSGAVVWSATYDAFGKATVDAGSSITNNLRFPGQYLDAETGLHYNYHRYYDPNTGRYVTEDPIGLDGGINYFSYSLNNPIKQFDSIGLKVLIGGHPAFDKHLSAFVTKPQSFHLFLYLEPNDKKTCMGSWPMTLGGQKEGDNLVGKVNYVGDNIKTANFSQEVKPPSGMDDCCFIRNLFKVASRYKGNLKYSLPYFYPAVPREVSGVMDINEYNSNSYVSGVLQAAGVRPPVLNGTGKIQTPGYQNPIPIPKE